MKEPEIECRPKCQSFKFVHHIFHSSHPMLLQYSLHSFSAICLLSMSLLPTMAIGHVAELLRSRPTRTRTRAQSPRTHTRRHTRHHRTTMSAPSSPAPAYFIGCDVGTGSARAGVVDATGRVLAVSVCPLVLHHPQAEHYEYASEQIWSAVCSAVRGAVRDSGVSPSAIASIGFDATCSLVVLGENDAPVCVTAEAEKEKVKTAHADDPVRNTIVWMDHRSKSQASSMTSTGHAALQSVGGVMSPEMHLPKILWLKETQHPAWSQAKKYMDLTDWLAYRASGVDVRSVCTVTCKMTYQAHLGSDDGWLSSFFEQVGLSEFPAENWQRLGHPSSVRDIGSAAGPLTAAAAAALGLDEHTIVSVGLIDAHAGGIGTIGARIPSAVATPEDQTTVEHRMAVIAGTSTCHMAVTATRAPVSGVWGPYFNAMVPGQWLLEGGESVTGALVDHIIDTHPACVEARTAASAAGVHLTAYLALQLVELATERGLEDIALLTRDVHVLPYFHGNRSPRADPSLLGCVSGLTLARGVADLAVKYLATLQALAYGTRHILEAMRASGVDTRYLFLTGGLAKNPLFVTQHAGRNTTKQQSSAVLRASLITNSLRTHAVLSLLCVCFVLQTPPAVSASSLASRTLFFLVLRSPRRPLPARFPPSPTPWRT